MIAWTVYDLALKDTWWSKLLQYPLAALFLLDHYVNWRHIEQELGGDHATNISSGLAKVSGWVGKIMRRFKDKDE